jgi:hypothetical protein
VARLLFFDPAMARIITKELAIEIARKLGASKHSKKNRPHDLYQVSYGGRIVATFGIRRGSEKDKGHDHIPGAIHLSPHDAKLFGQCDHTYDFWVEQMQQKGLIPREPDAAG